MTSKTDQLLLELMLLCSRYSAREVAEVQLIIDGKASSEVLLAMSKLLSSFGQSKETGRTRSVERGDINTLKKSFLESLGRAGQVNARRSRIIADKLDIKWDENDQSGFISAVEGQLNAMSDDELQEFLSTRPKARKPDEAYMNLATFLVSSREDTRR